MSQPIISETLRGLCGLADEASYLTERVSLDEMHIYNQTFKGWDPPKSIADVLDFLGQLTSADRH